MPSAGGSGGAIDGFTYLYRVGGQGILISLSSGTPPEKMARYNSWWVACDKDAMTDKTSCRVASPLIMASDVAVCAPSNTFPGTVAMVRVDSLPAVEMDQVEGKCVLGGAAVKLRAAMETGQTLAVRYHKWPYKAAVDEKQGLASYVVAAKMMEWLRAEALAGKLK